jgi:hypothetical protein
MDQLGPTGFDEQVAIDLDTDERLMLTCGLRNWGGPVRGSDALAALMGFEDMNQLTTQASSLIGAIKDHRALSVREWTRVLVATEINFASEVLGTGPEEWVAIEGWPPDRWWAVLRRLQRKLPSDKRGL